MSNSGRTVVIPGLVSTVIPVHNRPAMLREAVQSVLAQRYRPIEVIIVDDGSDDDTPAAIADLVEVGDGAVRSVRQVNQGPGVAREAGRQLVRGEFVQYLDSDDLLLPEKFVLQVTELRENPDCGVVYGKTHFQRVGEALNPNPYKRTGERFDTLFPELLRSRWWSTSTPLFRRSVTDLVGPWSLLWNEEDWEHDARVARCNVRLAYCDAFVSVTRSHGRHLCDQGSTDPRKLHDRAKAHELILEHALAAGIGLDEPDMRHFARELFLLSRQCGAAGLRHEARRLFDLARSASGAKRSSGWDFRAYRVAAAIFGWSTMGLISNQIDRLRP